HRSRRSRWLGVIAHQVEHVERFAVIVLHPRPHAFYELRALVRGEREPFDLRQELRDLLRSQATPNQTRVLPEPHRKEQRKQYACQDDEEHATPLHQQHRWNRGPAVWAALHEAARAACSETEKLAAPSVPGTIE